jgi:tRNA (adenine22-N1)-methyltransferase
VGTLVVSGLGGATIGAILRAAAPGALASLGRGVFQPNVGAPALRATLCALGWVIADEEVALCGGRFYQVIAAQPLAAAAAPPPPLDEADLLFGPVLRRRRPAAWLEMLRWQEAKWERVAQRVVRLTSPHARRAADVAGVLAQIRMEMVGDSGSSHS